MEVTKTSNMIIPEVISDMVDEQYGRRISLLPLAEADDGLHRGARRAEPDAMRFGHCGVPKAASPPSRSSDPRISCSARSRVL